MRNPKESFCVGRLHCWNRDWRQRHPGGCNGAAGWWVCFSSRLRVLGAALLLICSGTLGTTALAENWPEFRGPTRQGISSEKGVPLRWSATENIAWKTAIPGEGWSTPIVWDNHIFLTATTDEGSSCRVIAVDRKTGRLLWNREVFKQQPAHKHPRNSVATSTPATDGKRVYACFHDGSFAALDFSGKIVWTNRDYKYYSQHGLATSLVLFKDLLIMTRDPSSEGPDKRVGWQIPWDKSYIIALDAETGRQRWKAFRGMSRIGHGTPNIWEDKTGTQLVSETGDVMQGFDIHTGRLLWTSKVIGEGKVPSVVLGDGLVFTAGGFGGRESIKAFRLGGTGDLDESNLVWEQPKGVPKVPSMLYLSPYLYAVTDSGIVSCIEGNSGQIVWQQRLGGNFSASPVSAEGRIYFLSDEGETIVMQTGPQPKILARNPLNEKTQASMAISQGQILIRTVHNLYCIGAKEDAGQSR